jgi:hypothetical protein
MHKVRAAIVSGGASAYRLVASKSGKVGSRRRRSEDEALEPSLDPALVARSGHGGPTRQELAAALYTLRHVDSLPEDETLAHWASQPVPGEQPLLHKQGRIASPDEEEEEASLAGEIIPRRVSRTADTRREDRVTGSVDTAVLAFRGEDHVVRVVNTSSRGLQIASDLKAHIAEELSIRLDNGAPTPCHVRWIRGGRIGLGFREEDLSAA